jgi:hypothetical protein
MKLGYYYLCKISNFYHPSMNGSSHLNQSICFLAFSLALALSGCSNGEMTNDRNLLPAVEARFYGGKGIGPVTSIVIPDTLDSNLIAEGNELFNNKCNTCHEVSVKRKIGPGLSGITKLRTPEWIMNQILNPMEMTQKDSLAKELLAIYMAQMTDMELTEKQARAIYEFLRTVN